MDKTYYGDAYKEIYEQTQRLIPILKSLDGRVDEQKDLYGGDVDLVDYENGR